MLRGGASIRHVQEMLGHSSLRTTQIYTHIVKDDLKAIHAKTAPSERRAIIEAPAFEFTNWRPRKQKKPRAARKKGNPREKSPGKPPKEKPPDSSSSYGAYGLDVMRRNPPVLRVCEDAPEPIPDRETDAA